MDDLRTELEVFKEHNYETFANVEETLVEKDRLLINFAEAVDENPRSFNLEIPMTPTNVEILKKQLAEAGQAEHLETDGRGRINLGVQHSGETKKVIILE